MSKYCAAGLFGAFSRTPLRRLCFVGICISLSLSFRNERNALFVHAVVPTAGIHVQIPSSGTSSSSNNKNEYTLLASQASFGDYPEMGVDKNVPYNIRLPPKENPLLCSNASTTLSPQMRAHYKDSIVLVPRGECTFEYKAWIAQEILQSRGIVIYGNLASRYSTNESTGEPIFPKEYYDYDCDKGHANVPVNALQVPYNAAQNDDLLSGSAGNLCLKHSPNALATCPSKACLITGNTTDKDFYQVCCAWDLYIWMYNDEAAFNEMDTNVTKVSIPALYITMQQGQRLLQDLAKGPVIGTMFSRYRSDYNWSSLLIWALGVFVAALAAHISAYDYRALTRKILHRQQLGAAQQQDQRQTSKDGEGEGRSAPSSLPPPEKSAEESLELSAGHALGFILMASSGLFILFYFKIYSVVKIMYGLGCSRAIAQVIFEPLLRRIFGRCRIHNKVCCTIEWEDIGDVTLVDIVAGIIGFVIGLAWLNIAFTVRHAENNIFFWVTQDVMGACMCILFLGIIKLNSMRVASILLIVAFLYDIFFVFVTPLIFKESVMITVATSGGPPKADPSWCEKYPGDANCQGGDPLPMLLTVPRIFDYQGGSSLLGLGDIVLPGLLLSFAARLDAAKQVMGAMGGGNGLRVSTGTCGYFFPIVVAYGIGLFMANAAVYLMNMGQPALLYLVPMCLGCMTLLGWRRNELSGLWEGPRVIRTVDSILYGEYAQQQPSQTPQRVPTEEGLDAPMVPSALDEEDAYAKRVSGEIA